MMKLYVLIAFALPGVLFCIVFCEATVSEHTMLLEGACSRPPPKEANTGPVSGVEIMRKLSKSHTHNESALRIKVHDHSKQKNHTKQSEKLKKCI